MSMLLFVLHELWSIIDDSGFVVSSVVSSHPALLSFHMLAGNLDRARLTVSGNVATLEAFFQAVAQALFAAKPLTTVALGGVSFVEQFGRPLVKEDLLFSAV